MKIVEVVKTQTEITKKKQNNVQDKRSRQEVSRGRDGGKKDRESQSKKVQRVVYYKTTYKVG